tara:strand:- start:11457 stop:11690 length:234 start_codon:yes stop_codon:yes gene_type:complete
LDQSQDTANPDTAFQNGEKFNLLTGIEMIPAVIGLFPINIWATVAGLATMMITKKRFLDRMIWSYDDMKDKYPKHQN